MTARLAKLGKWLGYTFTTIIVTTLILVAIILFTHTGLNVSLWAVQKVVPELEVGETEGALLPKFTLGHVGFDDGTISVQIETLSLEVTPTCLMTPKVCIDNIAISGVDVSLAELNASPDSSSETATEEVEEKPSLLDIPVPIEVQQLILNDIHISAVGNTISWNKLETAATLSGSALNIAPTTFDGLLVALAESDSSEVNQKQPEVNNTSDSDRSTQLELPEVFIPLLIDIARFDITNFQLEGDAPVIVHRLSVEGSVGKHQIEIRTLELEMPEIEASLSGEVELMKEYPLSLNLNATMKQEEVKGLQTQLTATGSLGNLSINGKLRDLIHSDLSLNTNVLSNKFPFDVEIGETKLQWPLTGPPEYQVDLHALSGKGDLDSYEIKLLGVLDGEDIPSFDVDLEGTGTSEEIDLKKLTLKTLGGEVQGHVMANWASPVNWGAELQLTEIQPGLEWQQAEGSISGRIETSGQLTQQGGWKVELPLLDIKGVFRDYPVDISGEVTAQDIEGKGKFEFDTAGLSFAHGANQIQINGSLHEVWELDLGLHLPDISLSVEQAEGSIFGDVQLTGELMQPDAKLDLRAKDVAWQESIILKSLSVVGGITASEHIEVGLELFAESLLVEGQLIDKVEVAISGTEREHRLTLDLSSEVLSSRLVLSGDLSDKELLKWNGELSQAAITTEQGLWTLENAVELSFDGTAQEAHVTSHCWAQKNTHLCLVKDLSAGQSGEAYVDLRNFEFGQIKQYLPKTLELEGSVTANSWVKWSPQSEPEAKISVRLPEGQLTQTLEAPVTLGWQSVELSAQLAQGHMSAQWLVDIQDNGDLSGKVTIPNIQGKNPQIDAHLQLSTFDIQFLQPIVGEYSRANAFIESDVRLSGPIMHPKVDGAIQVKQLELMGDISPIEVKNGSMLLKLNGYDATLVADIETPRGDLDVVGEANWQDLDNWNTATRIFAEELRIDVPPMVKVSVIPDLTISVTPEKAVLDGDISFPWGRILVESLPQSAVKVSNDQVLLTQDLEPLEKEEDLPIQIETNINVSIGDDFKLTALGLDSMLEGQLNISRKDQAPYILGEINLVDGTYRSFGQDLLITEGKILMNGPASDPFVSIKAIRNPDNIQDDVIAGVRLSGSASAPEVVIYSEPAMPQANALSYLLRGQDIDGESGGNAMTTTLIGLSLAQGGQVVGDIGEVFGVQDLQLDTAGSGGDSQVTVSGYVLPGLQVKYGVGIFDSVGEFTVRYRIMKDLYIEAISGLDSAVDLLYQFEFD